MVEPQRKQRNHLTLIPEGASPITSRFNVALVGEQAEEFARIAVNTEFAEAYKPKACSQSHIHGAQGGEEGADGHCGKHEEDPFVFFCPTGGVNTKELARLRLQPCVHFSDSLPLGKDRAQNMSVIVVFLFWRCTTVKDAINDFRSRMAEVVHQPASCRPCTALLAFRADAEQEGLLKEFVDKQQQTTKMYSEFFSQDNEETVIDALQNVCETAIKFQKIGRKSLTFNNVDGDNALPKRCSCAIS